MSFQSDVNQILGNAAKAVVYPAAVSKIIQDSNIRPNTPPSAATQVNNPPKPTNSGAQAVTPDAQTAQTQPVNAVGQEVPTEDYSDYQYVSSFADKEDAARAESLRRSLGQTINKKRVADVFKSYGKDKYAENVMSDNNYAKPIVEFDPVDLSGELTEHQSRMLREYLSAVKRADRRVKLRGGVSVKQK